MFDQQTLDHWVHVNNCPISAVSFNYEDNVILTDSVTQKLNEMQAEIDRLKKENTELVSQVNSVYVAASNSIIHAHLFGLKSVINQRIADSKPIATESEIKKVKAMYPDKS